MEAVVTGPSYTVKNIEAIAKGSDMRARLYTLAPGEVIPWHYHTAVTD
jgi:quercetin dioxygenase-like cupin family protein